MENMIRYRRDIDFKETILSDIRILINEYAGSLKYYGDGFLAKSRSQCRHFLISLSNERRYVGILGIVDDNISFFYLSPEYRFMERQILERVLDNFNIKSATVASWDYHNIPVFMDFQDGIEPFIYQFQLEDEKRIRQPLEGIKVRLARDRDAAYMDDSCFINNALSYIRRQEAWIISKENGDRVGIGIISPITGTDEYLDIGVFVNPEDRKKGYGRSILSKLMKIVVDSGRVPVAACSTKNHESRRTLESSGMTCIGSLLKVNLDGDRFK